MTKRNPANRFGLFLKHILKFVFDFFSLSSPAVSSICTALLQTILDVTSCLTLPVITET